MPLLKHLNLSRLRSGKFNPESLLPLTNLTSLDMRQSDTICDEHMLCLTKLQTLKLSRSQLSESALFQLPNLTSLHLFYDSQITDNLISRMDSLLELALGSGTEITDDAVSRLTNLTSLKIHETITDRGISNLTNLTRLDSSSELISDIGMSKLTNLVSLRISGCPVTDHVITTLTQLRELRLYPTLGPSLISSHSLGYLTQLEKLAIEERDLQPPFSVLTNLKTLSITFNTLESDALSNLTNLTALDLFGSINWKKSGMFTLTNLVTLSVGFMGSSPEIANDDLSLFPHLTSLDISHNRLVTIDGISKLRKLQYLSWDNSSLDTRNFYEHGIICTPASEWGEIFDEQTWSF